VSVPDPTLTDWVPIGTGAVGPPGPKGDAGPQGAPGASEPRAGFRGELATNLSHIHWTLVSPWTKNVSVSGNWGSYTHAKLIPVEGWYMVVLNLHWLDAYSGGGQKQSRVEVNGNDGVGSGSVVCIGQIQESQPVDDFCLAAAVQYFNAGDTLRGFGYSGQTETLDGWSMFHIGRLN
jgi:hypothetical protein